jgi:hypothetical protein
MSSDSEHVYIDQPLVAIEWRDAYKNHGRPDLDRLGYPRFAVGWWLALHADAIVLGSEYDTVREEWEYHVIPAALIQQFTLLQPCEPCHEDGPGEQGNEMTVERSDDEGDQGSRTEGDVPEASTAGRQAPDEAA